MDDFLGVDLNARKRLSDTARIWLHFVAGGCLTIAIFTWAIPPWLLEKDSPRDQVIQGFCFVVSLLSAGVSIGIGYSLNRSEPYLKAQEQQEQKDYQHLLASARVASQSRREKALRQFIEGTLNTIDEYQQQALPAQDDDTLPQLAGTPNIEMYDWVDIASEANAFLVGGNPGSAKTTLVSGYIVPMLSQQMEAEIIICDPDAKANKWQRKGYTRVVSDYEAIFKTLGAVAAEKEARKQKDWTHQIILVCDELNDCQAQWDVENPKKFKDSVRYIRSLGNARKYGITPIIMMQNHLVETIGLKSKDRNQFAMILLCASAWDEATAKWKQTDPRWQWVHSQAYPAMVTGSIRAQAAVHPTHGHHTEFKKEGKEPRNVSPPLVGTTQVIPDFSKRNTDNTAVSDTPPPPRSSPPSSSPSLPNIDLHKAATDEEYPELSKEQAKILRWVIEKGGQAKLSDLLRQVTITVDGVRWSKQNYLNACRFIEDKGYLDIEVDGLTIWLIAPLD